MFTNDNDRDEFGIIADESHSPEQYRIDEVIEFGDDESGASILSKIEIPIVARSTSDFKNKDDIENRQSSINGNVYYDTTEETPTKENIHISTGNYHPIDQSIPGSPIAATRFVQQAVHDLQNDIIRRKAELEAIQQSNLRRNGNNLNALKYMVESRSLFHDHGSDADGISPTDANNKKRASSASRIPKRAMKKNLSPTSHGTNVAELSMQASEMLNNDTSSMPIDMNRDISHDVNMSRSKLDESYEEDEDRIKIRQIQSRYRMFSRPNVKTSSSGLTFGSSGVDDHEDPDASSSSSRHFFSSHRNRISPASSSTANHHDTFVEPSSLPLSSDYYTNAPNIVDQAVSVADHQIMNRLKSEQTRVLFLERRIKELEEENSLLLEKLSHAVPGEELWAEHAKFEVMEKRVMELEQECREHAQRVRDANIENTRLESHSKQLEEDYENCRDELLLIRSQLQSKSARVSALENDITGYRHQLEVLRDELSEVRESYDAYRQEQELIAMMNQERLFHDNVSVIDSATDPHQEHEHGDDKDNREEAEAKELHDSQLYDEFRTKLSILATQIDDLTRERDEFILKASNAEESLRRSYHEIERLSQALIVQQQKYEDYEMEMVDKLLQEQIKYAMSTPPPPIYEPVPEPEPIPSSSIAEDNATNDQVATELMIPLAEAAAEKAQAEIEIQHLRERLKRTERALMIFKYFYKMRDHMLEGKIYELQALAEVYEQERANHKRPATIIKEVIKEVIVPAKVSSSTRTSNLLLVAFLKFLIWMLILLCGYLYLVDRNAYSQPRYRITT